jgi:hypothetical protein
MEKHELTFSLDPSCEEHVFKQLKTGFRQRFRMFMLLVNKRKFARKAILQTDGFLSKLNVDNPDPSGTFTCTITIMHTPLEGIKTTNPTVRAYLDALTDAFRRLDALDTSVAPIASTASAASNVFSSVLGALGFKSSDPVHVPAHVPEHVPNNGAEIINHCYNINRLSKELYEHRYGTTGSKKVQFSMNVLVKKTTKIVAGVWIQTNTLTSGARHHFSLTI